MQSNENKKKCLISNNLMSNFKKPSNSENHDILDNLDVISENLISIDSYWEKVVYMFPMELYLTGEVKVISSPCNTSKSWCKEIFVSPEVLKCSLALMDSIYVKSLLFVTSCALIELPNNKLHGLLPSDGLVSPSGQFA